MNKTSLAHKNQNKNTLYSTKGILQRKCACGNKAISNGECTECGKKKNNLQRKLSIGENNDPLEREADRVADKVMAMSGNSMVRKAPLYIQRSTGQYRNQHRALISWPGSGSNRNRAARCGR